MNISLTPDPPVHDQSVLICLNGCNMPTKVTITLSNGDTATLRVDKSCVYWFVPANAKGLTVNFHDEGGQAADVSRVVA